MKSAIEKAQKSLNSFWMEGIPAAVQFSSVIASLAAFPVWGRHADWVGNAKLLKITSFIIPVIPLLWIFSRNPVILMLIELGSGFVWAGFNLCATNFIYDAVSLEKRVRCIGYLNLLNGMALFAGASLGGFLGDKLPKVNGYSLLGLFVLSEILRWAAHFLLSPHFQEVREAPHRRISSLKLFSVWPDLHHSYR